jgi:hypothetical protein
VRQLIDQAARVLNDLSEREMFAEPDELAFCSATGEYFNEDQLRDPASYRHDSRTA